MASLRDFSVDRGVRWTALKRTVVGICVVGTLLLILTSQFSNFTADMSAGRRDGLLAFGCVVTLLVVFGWHGLLALRTLLAPRSHPIYTHAARQGMVDTVIADIERQVRESGQQVGPAVFTGQFMLNTATMALMEYQDIMWIYKRTLRQAHEMIVYTRDGQQQPVTASSKVVDQLLLTVAQVCPWVVVGYSDQLWNLWSNSRDEFIAQVDARRP